MSDSNFELSLGFGRILGRVCVARSIDEICQRAGYAARGSVLCIDWLPDSETLEKIKLANYGALILPPVTVYSHVAAKIWSLCISAYSTSRYLTAWDSDWVEIDFEQRKLEFSTQSALDFGTRQAEIALEAIKCTRIPGNLEVFAEISTPKQLLDLQGIPCSGIGVMKCEAFLQAMKDQGTIDQFCRNFEKLAPNQPLYLRFFDLPNASLSPLTMGVSQSFGVRGARLLTSMDGHVQTFIGLLDSIGIPVVAVIPMVSSPDEVSLAFDVFGRHCAGIGVTVETPAAALQIADFVSDVAFAEIGINDLTQYTTAWHRDIPNESLVPSTQINPAVGYLVAQVSKACAITKTKCLVGLDHRPSEYIVRQLLDLEVGGISCAAMLVPHWVKCINRT